MIPVLSRVLRQPGFIVWLPFFFLACSPGRAEETRAVWVVRHGLTTPERVAEIVARADSAGLNTLFVQVRGRGDAYYRSDFVPPGEDVAPGFDPLQACIDLARVRGLEVHAWVNVFLTWYVERPPPEDHLLATNPEWFMISQDGVDLGQPKVVPDLIGRGVEGRYLSPGLPAVTDHLLRVVEEIVTRYDIDGVHLDYVRYPNEHYDFSPLAQAAYWADLERDPPAPDASEADRLVWNRWRSEQVTRFVRQTRHLVRRLRPDVLLSAAVKPDLALAYGRYGQDWTHWVNRRYLDFVVPMFYTGSTSEILTRMMTIRKYVQKGRVCAGIGAWNQTASDTFDQIAAAERAHLDGFSIFSYDTLASSSSLRTGLRRRFTGGGR